MGTNGAGWISYGVLALILLCLLTALWRSGFLGRLSRLIEEMVLGNWQLALLAAAGIALSLASGYTTFDGMRSFTAAPLLSALVTFGIQGVLLIVSWLIGESFAAGLRRDGGIVQSYVEGIRLILKNAVLWVMLLATMGCSVFFSFDSHFSSIFPPEQRRRAAEIRTLNQVAGIVADIGARTRQVRAAAIGRLLESKGWKAYEARLDVLERAAGAVQAQMEAALVASMEARQRGIGEQQGRIAAAERSRSALVRRRDELEAELQRLEVSIGTLEAELAKARAAYHKREQAIAAKKIEAAAEDGGVEGSGKRGKGPAWRRRMAELEELQRKLSIADGPRLEAAQRRRDEASARIVGLKREIATVIAEAAKYDGAIATARRRIEAAREGGAGTGRIDPAGLIRGLERARTAFRQRPEPERLAAIRARCERLLGALSGVPAAGQEARGTDCDPQTAAAAAARVFALNAGVAAFEAGCAGGAKLPQEAGTDALLAFGRKCLQDSGLTSEETAGFGARFQAIEMNRDDKAHRFVVTWNAFLDGNRLGYLALALAIGVDSLVFMAGLFGAAAARSPLSDLPSPRARSADALEAVIRNALGEDRLETAELVLSAMRPAPGEDRRSEIDLAGCDAGRAERIRKVLVAGRSIGAVERASSGPDGERYLIRPELMEFLSAVASAAQETGRARADRARVAEVIGLALAPDRPGNAAIVLHHAEPIAPRGGFVARIDIGAVAKEKDRRVVQGVVGAGLSVGAVARQSTRSGLRHRALRQRPDTDGTAYLISAELFETLLQHRASAPAKPAVRREAEPVRLTAKGASSARMKDEIVDAFAEESPPLLTDARSAEPSEERDEDELRRLFLDALFGAAAAEAKAVAAAISRRPAAVDPRAALERLGRDIETALQRTACNLEREHGKDRRELLGEVCHEIAGNKPGLLEDLIGKAERDGDDDLLGLLRRLRDDLATMEME